MIGPLTYEEQARQALADGDWCDAHKLGVHWINPPPDAEERWARFLAWKPQRSEPK